MTPGTGRIAQTAAASDPATMNADELAIMSIKLVKARYMECINEKLWDGLVECLTPDASVAYENGRHTFFGRDDIIDYLRDNLALLDAIHIASNPRIALIDESTARGMWDLRFQWHDPWDNTSLHGAGVYSDRYVRHGGAWQISFTGFVLTS